MESSNQIRLSFLKGKSAREASEKPKNKFQDYYSKMLSSNTDADSLQAAQCLWWDQRNQVCLGDGEARV